ncbi:hypothetical protein, partial [Vibrio vulnificus]|uniref:hypothetical protein n=1 Tax=Vibrio vulnificus TaxID=672 RepID=UPI001F405D6A
NRPSFDGVENKINYLITQSMRSVALCAITGGLFDSHNFLVGKTNLPPVSSGVYSKRFLGESLLDSILSPTTLH